jgi:hypothetical protein
MSFTSTTLILPFAQLGPQTVWLIEQTESAVLLARIYSGAKII